MVQPDNKDEEAHFEALVEAYDDALASGSALPDTPVSPELRQRLTRAQQCLRLLDRDRQLSLITPLPGLDASQGFTLDPVTGKGRLGHFRLDRELGRGGCGVVFLAYDELLDRELALKVPRAEMLLSPEARQRFLREARAAAALDHPHIVRVHEAREVGGVCYLASTYCSGPTLAAWLQVRTEPIPSREAAALVATLADAVQYTHERGILHRDLKPTNILFDAGGRPLVADFGLAKLFDPLADDAANGQATPKDTDSLTMTGTQPGTPQYMAPEQAAGQNRAIGPAADIYALGTILYEVLTRRPPFVGVTLIDILRQLQEAEPTPLRRLRRDVPRDLEVICLTCLRKEPKRRYVSAAALGQDLRRFLNGEPILARPASVLERASKWVRRRPAVAALVAVSSAAALCLFAGVLWYGFQVEKHNVELQGALTRADDERLRVEEAWRVEQRVYADTIKVAGRLWENAQFDPMIKLLEHLQPAPGSTRDLRGFEWHYLWGLAHRRGRQLSGMPADGVVQPVVFSPDSKILAIGSNHRVIALWDTTTWTKRATLNAWGRTLAFSPDGKILATGGGLYGQPGELKLWEVTTATELANLSGHRSGIACAVFSPDGKTLAVCDVNYYSMGKHSEVKFWDVATRRVTKSTPVYTENKQDSMHVNVLAFTPDGKHLILGSSNGLMHRCENCDPNDRYFIGSSNGVIHSLQVSADGRTLAYDAPEAAALGNVFGLEVKKWLKAGGVLFVQYSPDEKLLAAASKDGCIRVWDTANWQVQALFRAADSSVDSLGFAPDGKTLAAGTAAGVVTIWDTREVQTGVPMPGHAPYEAWSAAFAPDGKSLVTAGDDSNVRFWDVATAQQRGVLKAHIDLVTSVAFAPQGDFFATGGFDHTVHLWDSLTRQQQALLEGHTDKVRCVAFAPDGRTLASGSRDQSLRLWDVPTGKQRQVLLGHTDAVNTVAYAPDGATLASASNDGTIRLWNADTGKELFALTGDSPWMTVAFAPDGKTLAAGNRAGDVVLWDLATREKRVLNGHKSVVRSVAFSPDGKTLASGSQDNTIRLWEPTLGLELLTLTGHANWVNGVAFAPDGQTLASACNDGSIKLWRASRE
jgi:WD40 repeat protein/serine/threonine protein kinase